MDPAHVEKVEAELDSFIERRARERADANKVDELWAESDRRERVRGREENREAWRGFHAHMQALHAGLSEEHKIMADALAEEEPGEG